MTWKLKIGFVLGIVFFIACLGLGFRVGSSWLESSTNVLLALFGGTFGWVVGILISPAKDEVQEFEKIGGAILTFVSGYGVAKLNDLFGVAVADGKMPDDLFICRVLITVTTFCLGALFSSIARRYWDEEKARGRQPPKSPPADPPPPV